MKKIFVIHDEKANVHLQPFVSDNAATASRMLEGSAQDKQSFLGLYPEDYSVYCIGEYDEQAGTVKPLEKREYCFRMLDLVRDRKSVVPSVLETEAKGEIKNGGKKKA